MSTQNTEFILVLFIIVLFFTQTTVNLLLPHPVFTESLLCASEILSLWSLDSNEKTILITMSKGKKCFK